MDPAETHWQGHKIAAAASQHEAAAGQGDSGRDRALDTQEHTLAELAVDPAETHWQGPRTAAAASLQRAAAEQGDSSQDRAQEGEGTHARRAVDPAETHWQGHRIAAAASQYRGGYRAGRLRSPGVGTEHWTRRNTRSQSWLWISRRRIGKGPGQPPQLACRGRQQGRATQVAWNQQRALEEMELTLAELWITRRRIGKGTG